jgi:cathepsin A (carboxypeptidase C)
MGNKASNEGTEHVNLKGVAIGNGLTDPEVQYKYYPEMAYNNPHGIKAVGKVEYEAMKKAVPTCTKMIHECNAAKVKLVGTFKCQAAFNYCNMAMQVPYQLSGKNPYDISKKCEVKPLCYDFSNITKFLNLESTRKALNVSDKSPKWESCNMAINMMFRKDWMADLAPYVKDLLEAGIPVLIYAGDLDFICNYMGNKAWALGMDWKHKDDFNKAEDHEWNNKTGLARTSNKFTFLQVYNAGHMSPTDQPEVTLEMVKQFLNEAEF